MYIHYVFGWSRFELSPGVTQPWILIPMPSNINKKIPVFISVYYSAWLRSLNNAMLLTPVNWWTLRSKDYPYHRSIFRAGVQMSRGRICKKLPALEMPTCTCAMFQGCGNIVYLEQGSSAVVLTLEGIRLYWTPEVGVALLFGDELDELIIWGEPLVPLRPFPPYAL